MNEFINLIYIYMYFCQNMGIRMLIWYLYLFNINSSQYI